MKWKQYSERPTVSSILSERAREYAFPFHLVCCIFVAGCVCLNCTHHECKRLCILPKTYELLAVFVVINITHNGNGKWSRICLAYLPCGHSFAVYFNMVHNACMPGDRFVYAWMALSHTQTHIFFGCLSGAKRNFYEPNNKARSQIYQYQPLPLCKFARAVCNLELYQMAQKLCARCTYMLRYVYLVSSFYLFILESHRSINNVPRTSKWRKCTTRNNQHAQSQIKHARTVYEYTNQRKWDDGANGDTGRRWQCCLRCKRW